MSLATTYYSSPCFLGMKLQGMLKLSDTNRVLRLKMADLTRIAERGPGSPNDEDKHLGRAVLEDQLSIIKTLER